MLNKQSGLWKENSWILHNDNSQSHKAPIVNVFLTKNLPKTFLKFKLPLGGRCFVSIDFVKENSLRELKAISSKRLKSSLTTELIAGIEIILKTTE